jgi:hypothetical protein
VIPSKLGAPLFEVTGEFFFIDFTGDQIKYFIGKLFVVVLFE